MSELLDTADADVSPAESRASRSAVPPIRPTDAERLMRFWRRHDQAALEELIECHAPMVWGVCSQILRRREDVEDAFQATFLILARKAKTIRAADSIAGWLYRVAFRTALLAHNRRNRLAETPLVYEPAADDDQLEAIARNEQCRVLLEELHALPLQYREPLVLCYLEGRTRSEAADELGVTQQSVKGRLARGTRLLRSRMVSRGAALSTTMALVTASMSSAQAAAPPTLISTTTALATSFAMKLAGAAPKATATKTAATVLAEKGILSMTLIAAAKPAVAVLGICLAAGMFAVATADAPSGGGGSGESSVLLLADSDAGANVLEVGADEVEISVNERRDEARNDSEDEFQAPVTETTIAAADPQPKPQPTVEVFAAVAAPAKVPAVPAAPAAVATIAEAPAKTINAWSGGGGGLAWTDQSPNGAEGAVNSLNFRLTGPADPFAVSLPRTLSATGSSEQALKLEQEYWDIKANALKMKAEALASKANSFEETGADSRTEVLEARADSELALAEVKLCEVNALKIKEQRDAADAGKLKRGAKGAPILILQQLLNDRVQPSPKLDLDGEFGPLTERAVKKFQQASGLPDTGVVDEKTGAGLGIAIPFGGGPANAFQSPFGALEIPIEVRKRLEAEAPLKETRSPRMIIGAGELKSGWSPEPPKVRVQIEKAMAAAKEAAVKQAAAAKQEAQTAERRAQADALRSELDAMRAALKELQSQLEEAERQKAEEHEQR